MTGPTGPAGSGDGVAFAATINGPTTTSGGIIKFDDTPGSNPINFDLGNNYNPLTGFFTAPSDGVYLFTSKVVFQTPVIESGSGDITFIIVIDGTNEGVTVYSYTTTQQILFYDVSIVVNLTAGATASIQCAISGSALSFDIVSVSPSNTTFFTGVKLS